MPLYKNKNIYLIFANTLAGIISVSVLIPALPVIAREFSLSQKEIGLLITSYTLPGVIFGIFMGIFADKFGRKALMVPSLLLFGIAGGAIYWLEDFFWINVFRFVQGIGGAILPSISTVLIGDLFHEGIRMRVMGLNAAVLSFGTAFFPFFGGMLATHSWNAPFLVFWAALPLAAAVAFFMDEPPLKNDTDIGGYFRAARNYIFTRRSLLVFATGTAIFILLYGGILTYLTLYMDERFKMAPFTIGMVIASASIATALFSVFSHRLVAMMGERRMFSAGFVMFGVTFFLILAAGSGNALFLPIFIFGGAMGMTIPLLQNIVTQLSPMEYRGLMSSLLGTLIRLGQTLGPMLLAIALYFGPLRLIFWVCAVLSLIIAAALFLFGEQLSANHGGKNL
ncbi:MAG: MFS transporter [Nitrospinota bacterium]